MEKQTQHHIYKVNEVKISDILWNLRPCLYGVKMFQVERSPASPSYLGQANISLENLVSNLHEKQKNWPGHPFVMVGSFIFLAGPAFLHINTLAHPAGSTFNWSKQDNQRMCMHMPCWLKQRGQLFLSGLNWEGDRFSPYTRDLSLQNCH